MLFDSSAAITIYSADACRAGVSFIKELRLAELQNCKLHNPRIVVAMRFLGNDQCAFCNLLQFTNCISK